MRIGQLDLGPRPVALAPMEDVTDASFRLICKEMGADMTYSEFVSADALIRNIAAPRASSRYTLPSGLPQYRFTDATSTLW